MKKLKLFFKKPIFKKVIGPIVRPFVKSVPLVGPPLVEATTNLLTEDGTPKKHNTTSIAISIGLVVLAGLDLYFNNGENLKFLIRSLLALIG